MDSNELECKSRGNLKSIPTLALCCESIGQTSLTTETSEAFELVQLNPSTCFVGAFHARTLATRGPEPGLQASAAAYGVNTRELLASFDPASSSWKTSQLCLGGEWSEFSETWPESGMTRNGRLFRLVPWARHMCDDECSLWPTPTASMDGRGFGIPLHERSGRYKKATVRRVHALIGEHGWRIHPHFTEALMGYPQGWTEIAEQVTPSSRRSPKSSAEPS